MNDDASSIGGASAAVAMANSAIDNARRAAASSRRNRTAVPPGSPRTPLTDAMGVQAGSSGAVAAATTDMDLKHNDNAYHVIATLVTERLMPKIGDGSTHYTLTEDDIAFFQKMLPFSVRRGFVDAVRYRLQLLKSGIGSRTSALGQLTMHCQLLGLDRESSNVLLDLNPRAGTNYPINYKSQGPVAVTTSNEYNSSGNNGDNGVTFGLETPMAYSKTVSPTNTFSPTNHTSTSGIDVHDYETSTSESLARQQIMAEINETKFLMRGSVTPDAVNFWKKHLEELNQRLVALGLEEQLKSGAGSPINAAGGGGLGSSSNVGGNRVGYSHEIQEGGMNYAGSNVEQHQQPTYSAPIEPHSVPSFRGRVMGSVGATPGTQGNQYYGDEHNNMANAGNVEMTPQHTFAPMPSKQQDEMPVCDVVAPSDLPGGYMFEAQLGSKKFLATVPPGGVTKGQRFVSTMRELETIEIPVPLGGWRDGGTECLNDGVCHPLFLNTLFFPCVALGQIMTRTGLDWQGEPSNKLVSSTSCMNMSVLLGFWLAMNASASFMLRVAWERGQDIGGEYYLPIIFFNICILGYMIWLVRKVRQSIRHKYQIPEDKCEGIEDCMCATFCMPCAICQMGRHTADFDTYRATCCTSTGLPRQVELAPVTFYEDQYQNMDDEPQAGGQMI